MFQVSIAILLCTVSAATFYLAAEHQRLLEQALPKRLMYGVSGLSFVGSLAYLNILFGPATAVFFQMTIIMLVLSIAPIILAYCHERRSRVSK